jgi:NhaA family Na+:H+ antiporter
MSLLCGIGFTMSLFIGLLAFGETGPLQDQTKVGVLLGSLVAAVAGWGVLRMCPKTSGQPAKLSLH